MKCCFGTKTVHYMAIYTFISHINFSRNMPTEMSFYRSPSYSIIIVIVCFKVVLTTSLLNNLLPKHVDYSFYLSYTYSIIIVIVCFIVVLITSRLNNLLPNHVDYSFPYLNQEDVRFQPSFLPVGYPLWSVVLLYLF